MGETQNNSHYFASKNIASNKKKKNYKTCTS